MRSITELTQAMDSIKAKRKKLMKEASQVIVDLISLRVNGKGKIDIRDAEREITNLLDGFSAEEQSEILLQVGIEIAAKSNANKESARVKKEAAGIFTGRIR